MAASFAFGFSGDDIEVDAEDEQMTEPPAAVGAQPTPQAPKLKPKSHVLADLLASLPSKISYSTVEIESPLGGIKLQLPRRELFDVKIQLMAEDDVDPSLVTSTSSEHQAPAVISGLDDADIRTNVYEGGFKSWECSFDLARLLLDRGPRRDLDDLCRVDHVVELGCGTSIPSLVLFHHAVTNSLAMYFTLADYNEAVLRLVTLPNLLLTWASTLPATEAPFSEAAPNPLALLAPSTTGNGGGVGGDLDVTPALKVAFAESLAAQGLTLNFVSGSWEPSAAFVALVPTAPEMSVLVLASETIYSPAAPAAFAEALVGILKQVRIGKALIAAKRVYFGVGGGVDAFKVECRERKAVACEVVNHGLDLGESGGVRRCLVEVQML